ncbi:hypothetical protein D3C73_1450950 [compost metagenome]
MHLEGQVGHARQRAVFLQRSNHLIRSAKMHVKGADQPIERFVSRSVAAGTQTFKPPAQPLCGKIPRLLAIIGH